MRNAILWIFALCFSVSMVPAPASAIDLKSIPKVPVYREDWNKNFAFETKKITNDKPYGDELLSYQINIPSGWTTDADRKDVGSLLLTGTDLSTSVLAILARYISPAVNLQRSNIVVEGQKLTYEISAVSWFVNFALSNGFTMTAMTVHSSRSLDALYVEVEKDQTFVVYTRVMVNGSNLIMVRYYLPQENFVTEKAAQAQTMSSFKLSKTSDAPIEPQETYGFLDQSYFNYPKSWELKEKSIFSVERMSATLLQARKERKQSFLEGRIRVEAVSKLLKTDLSKEIARFRSELKINNYKLGSLIETVDYKYDPSIKMGKAQVYSLDPDDKVNMQAYELLVAAMEGDDYYYICSLITPSREQEYYTWARNTETARVVIESLRRYNMPQIDTNDPYYDYLKQ